MTFQSDLATAVIGIDTLFGGDVMNPSGTGRFIADCWFSDEVLPSAYTVEPAARIRAAGGVGPDEDRAAVDEYLRRVDVRGAIDAVRTEARRTNALRAAYLDGLALCLDVMWELAMELHGAGEPVPYGRCVEALTGRPPEPSDPGEKRDRLRALLASPGGRHSDSLLDAVDRWRRERIVARTDIASAADLLIGRYDALAASNLTPHLPAALAAVPRANVTFLPLENAWFSGSMNYIGRARNPDGSPQYEATYEINASLQVAGPEFEQLVVHEVVPGHVTTLAYLQNLYIRGEVGFEASLTPMCTRLAVLFEGIANNAILIAYGITEIDQIPDPDLQIGLLLALLQDDAKNQASYLTWSEGWRQEDVASELRRDCLVSEERADKLSGAWGRHPLMGRMYLPAYRYGTNLVARLRREHEPETILPLLYGARGIVDAVTVEQALQSPSPARS